MADDIIALGKVLSHFSGLPLPFYSGHIRLISYTIMSVGRREWKGGLDSQGINSRYSFSLTQY